MCRYRLFDFEEAVMNYKIWCSFMFLFGILLSGCTPKIEEVRDIRQPNSAILGKLLQRSDLNSGWVWLIDSRSQNQETPKSENHGMVEKALQSLSGFYREDHYITIHHSLERYSVISNMYLSDIANNTGPNTFNLEFEKFGENQISRCIIESKTEVCDIENVYGDLLSRVTIISSDKLDNVTIVQLVNLVLEKIDSRMRLR